MNFQKFIQRIYEILPDICTDKELVEKLPKIFKSAVALCRLRKNKLGPAYIQVGKWDRIIYLKEDVIEWIKGCYKQSIEIEEENKEDEMKKQSMKDKLDEKLGMKDGKESTKKQSMKSRRDESKGMKKKGCQSGYTRTEKYNGRAQMSIIDVLKELFGKEEKNMLINELKSLFASDKALNSVSVVLSGVSQLVAFIDNNISEESNRGAAIDAVIKLLEAEKR